MSAPFRLALGVTPEQALERLRLRVAEVDNIANGSTPRGPDAFPEGPARDAYVVWVESVEEDLRWLSADLPVLSSLHSERFWRVRELYGGSTRGARLIEGEARQQRAMLQRVVEDLEERAQRARQAPGSVTVLDTNVLLHCQRPDNVAWTELLGPAQVRLIVPLRVVEELDAKKHSESQKLRQRARDLLPWLEKTIGRAGCAGSLRRGVTIEVAVPGPARSRPPDADEEILDVCVELAAFGDGPVTLVTGDTAMRLRAQTLGIAVRSPPAL